MFFEIDKLVSENVTPIIDKFLPKQWVYHEKFGYLQIKKFDESKQSYFCKVKRQEQEDEHQKKEQEEVEVKQEEISQNIIVVVKILTESLESLAHIKVNINDPILGLGDLFKAKIKGTGVVYKGNLILNKDSYLKRHVLSGERFLLCSSISEIKKWTRGKV